jgi:hypothetical protein
MIHRGFTCSFFFGKFCLSFVGGKNKLCLMPYVQWL